MKIIFIHGRAQGGKDPVQLQRSLENALRTSFAQAGYTWPQTCKFALPYYGDTLDQLTDKMLNSTESGGRNRGDALDSDALDIELSLLYELAQEHKLLQYLPEDSEETEAIERGVLNWEALHTLLQLFDRTPIGATLVRLITRDVHVYLKYKHIVQNVIDAEVLKYFAPGETHVVIGHSLGSVVGYNVLHKLPANTPVSKYVTIGSPLGIKAVKERLAAPLRMPANVQRWYNAMDERDVVPLFPLDEENFPILPAIINKTNVNNISDNHHGAEEYLMDPDVAREVHEALAG